MAIAKRKKKFFDIEIPIIKKQTQAIAYELNELDGKFINYDLTRSLRGKSLLMQLKIKFHPEKKELIAIPRQIKLLPYFLKRMIRKGTNYVEDSFSAQCKDAKIRIKPFLITRRELIEYVKNKTSYELFDEILKNQLQRPLSLKLKKIYPLSLCEIRVMKVEKEN